MPNICTENTPQSHKIAISAADAFDADPSASLELGVIQNNHQWQRTFSEDDGNNGTPWRPSTGVALSMGQGTGSLTLRPRVSDLLTILPLLFGGSFGTDHNGDALAADEMDSDFICDYFTLWSFMNTHVQKHENAKTNSATISSSKSSPILQLEWNIESCDYTQLANTAFPSGLTRNVEVPFVHTSSTFTVNSVTYPSDNCSISVNNNLVTDESYNSTTRTSLPPGDQVIQFTHTIPMTSAALPLLSLDDASVAGQVVYTAADGDYVLTFDFPALHSPVPTPVTPSGNATVKMEGLQWTARSTDSSGDVVAPILITLEDTSS